MRIPGSPTEGHHAESTTASGYAVRCTRKGDAVYAITLATPRAGNVFIRDLEPEPDSTFEVVGSSEPLKWSQEGTDVSIEIPLTPAGDHAFAIRVAP